MNYIIDPKVFWMIDVADAIDTWGIIFAVISGAFLLIYLFGALVMEDWDFKPVVAIFVSLVFLIGSAVATVIPNKDTMVLMTAASVATYDNVENVTDEIYKIIDYIDEAIED